MGKTGIADDMLTATTCNVERELKREIECKDPVWRAPLPANYCRRTGRAQGLSLSRTTSRAHCIRPMLARLR